jgi:hypothetical protein
MEKYYWRCRRLVISQQCRYATTALWSVVHQRDVRCPQLTNLRKLKETHGRYAIVTPQSLSEAAPALRDRCARFLYSSEDTGTDGDAKYLCPTTNFVAAFRAKIQVLADNNYRGNTRASKPTPGHTCCNFWQEMVAVQYWVKIQWTTSPRVWNVS